MAKQKQAEATNYSPRVLRNKGIPIDLLQVEQGPTGAWRPVPVEEVDDADLSDPKAGRPLETVYVKFDFNVVADLEAEFGGIQAWQLAMEASPASSVRKTLSLILARPVEQVGRQMVEGDLQHYGGVIGIAWAIANGVDPFVAADMLEKVGAAEAEARVKQQKLLHELQNEDTKEAPAEDPTLLGDS